MQQPRVTEESNSRTVDLAKRLKAAGAKMYGAFWCSHCFEQKQAFGKEAMADFPYVECYPDGYYKVPSSLKMLSDHDPRGHGLNLQPAKSSLLDYQLSEVATPGFQQALG